MRIYLGAVEATPVTCPQCDGPLSMAKPGRGAMAGQVVQMCKTHETCGVTVWSDAVDGPAVPVVDDGSRHARYLLPVTSEPEPPVVVAPNRWTSLGRMARRELAALNQQDRKLAAAGGDR